MIVVGKLNIGSAYTPARTAARPYVSVLKRLTVGRRHPTVDVMCGRYVSTIPPDLLAATLAAMLGAPTNAEPNWNVAPTQQAPVVRRNPDGERQIDRLTWGLVPYWTKALKEARRPINARSETVNTSGMFKGAYAKRRCLVPVDLFYEWVALPDGKQPYAITRADERPLVFGGLWESWKAPDGAVLRTYAIVTTTANAEMATLHDRMPVVLERGDWPAWLGEVEGNPADLMRPAPDGTLCMWPVSRAVNSVRNNGPALIDRIDDPAAQPPSDAPAGQTSA